MNRSSKGFGLAGVLATVVFLIVAAIFSASPKSQPIPTNMATYATGDAIALAEK
ncbi:MAG: hypothetical protein ACW7DO_11040 [Paraglaciecola chathamensis]